MKCFIDDKTGTVSHLWLWDGDVSQMPAGTPCECGETYYGKPTNGESPNPISKNKPSL